MLYARYREIVLLCDLLDVLLASITIISGWVANSAVLVGVTNTGLAETIELALPGVDVEEDGESECDEETSQGDSHGDVVSLVVSQETSQGREESTTRDSGNDE